MYAIAASAIVGAITGLLIALRYNEYAAIFTGTFVALLVFFLISRAMVSKLQDVQARAMKHLEELQANPSPQKQRTKFDLAIKTLEEGFRFKNWMILGESQINSQIGYIYYLRKDFDKATPYLVDAFSRNWVAMAMLASLHYRKKDYAEMEKAIEKAIKYNKKEAFLWGLYAWFEDSRGNKGKAIEILGRAAEKNPDDEWIKKTLLNLQNKKKVKMSKFADMWYQMHFESPPMRILQQSQPKFSALRRRP